MTLRAVIASLIGAGVLVFTITGVVAQSPTERAIDDADLKSGYDFQSEDTRALQDDDFANPGFLWVDKGAALFSEKAGKNDRACTTCHTDTVRSIKGAAARYPSVDEKTGQLINIEQRINLCRERHQQAEPLSYESEDLLAMTAYVAHQSRGQPFNAKTDGTAQSHFEAGRDYYYARKGQMNLACHHCHEWNWGQMLRGDRLSQGHGNGYPAYRFEWQTIGSLHRRLRNCDKGVRAEPLPFGAQEYVDLELYLAWRASRLTLETPSVRR